MKIIFNYNTVTQSYNNKINLYFNRKTNYIYYANQIIYRHLLKEKTNRKLKTPNCAKLLVWLAF